MPHIEFHDSLNQDYTITITNPPPPTPKIGTPQSTPIPTPNGKTTPRWGITTSTSQPEPHPHSPTTKQQLRPWLHLLDTLPSCTVYQNMSIPEIVKSAAKEQGFTDIKENLTNTHKPHDYIVQYNEPLRPFLLRIMAEEGIFHYFTHDSQTHTMILADSPSSLPKARELKWRPASASTGPDISIWDTILEYRDTTTKASVDDYNPLTPATSLAAEKGSGTRNHKINAPGTGYTEQSQGDAIARNHLASLQKNAKILHGKTNASDLTAGSVFKLQKCPVKETNGSWVITELHLAVSPEGMIAMHFSAIPPEAISPPLPPRPRVTGPLTGIVTGDNDDEILTDEYGRIKVKLLWDKKTPPDAGASCWLRVSQPWAGSGYGALFLPRVGQEVIVDFLDGDPSRPFVSGCLYNGTNRPGWKLPDNKTITGILGRSSPKGDAGNEISMDDAKDNERLYFHAQKLLECLIENERRVTITGEGGDSLVIDKASRTIEIKKGDHKLTLGEGSRLVDITKGDDQQTIAEGSRTAQISKGDDTLTIGEGNRTAEITKGDDTLTLSEGSRTVDLSKGDDSLTVKGKRTVKIEGDYDLEVGGNLTIKADGKITIQSTKDAVTMESKTAFGIKAGDSLKAESTSSMTLSGKGGLTGETDAALKLSGSTVSISGDASSELKGATTKVSGSAMLSLSGGAVKIN